MSQFDLVFQESDHIFFYYLLRTCITHFFKSMGSKMPPIFYCRNELLIITVHCSQMFDNIVRYTIFMWPVGTALTPKGYSVVAGQIAIFSHNGQISGLITAWLIKLGQHWRHLKFSIRKNKVLVIQFFFIKLLITI